MNLLNQLKTEVQAIFKNARGSHDWEHTQRVLTLANHIAKTENANQRIVQLAAILHDIARHIEDKTRGTICHADEGAKQAAIILKKYAVNQSDIDCIIHCISTHRFRNNNHPVSLEAKTLFDADKLDSIGATGIGRAFLFAGEVGARLHNKNINIEKTSPYTEEDTAFREYWIKLRFIKDRMLTEEGKRLAKQRHIFMTNFFKELDLEVDGLT